MTQYASDFLVIGSGVAGLTAALGLAELGSVAVLAKCGLTDTATLWAQGGIAAVMADTDSFAAHIQDTLVAGAGLCHADVVSHVVQHGPQAIRSLVSQGVAFTREHAEGLAEEGDTYHLTREGGHSQRRVLHAADATGRAIEISLASRARSHPNIRIFEQHLAVDLITGTKLGLPDAACLGAYAFDKQRQQVRTFAAKVTILATGGAGKVYLYTSNPDVATGDGISMAYRAGCRISNMEFIQFHPTCLYHPQAKSFLITEAVRGEGGRLKLINGEPFMQRYDPRAELAPRDIVARAIDAEMKRRGDDHVLLDISHKPAEFIKTHFPNIYQRCLQLGLDMTKGPIPVVPAAHYTCGGVMVDLQGRTDLPRLYAIGEVTHTGLHGANRLASNSLLECVVYAESLCADIGAQWDHLSRLPLPALPAWDESRVTDSDEEVVVSHNWDELRRFMWDYVGIVRSNKRLARAKRRVDLLKAEIDEYYSHFRLSNDLIELRNLVLVADLIIQSAQARHESRGLHFSLDYAPNALPPLDTVMQKDWPAPRLVGIDAAAAPATAASAAAPG
ncbi:MAG: L-aspartate oxidase [Pseudomonadota bacterium]|uniref:L-aspartate oxidase n=1 Tax=Thermithiobacillus tepidarius TaxID=929 RepID=UPI0004295286|nr:L-aspartate oxidase [Thermithiobacillus tepidarius]